jgi:hypothetical protein
MNGARVGLPLSEHQNIKKNYTLLAVILLALCSDKSAPSISRCCDKIIISS